MGHSRYLGEQLFLLDTNVLSALIKDPRGIIASRLREIPNELIATSIIVSCELRFGAEKKSSPRLAEKADALLKMMHVLPIGSGVDRIYAKTRAAMEQRGHGISAHDLLIASQAIFYGATLVTENQREFSRVPDLKMESWGS